MKAQTKSVGLGKWAVRGLFLTAVAAMSVATGCSAEAEEASQGGDDTSGEMGQSQDEVREVIPGPIAKSTAGEAWAVENQWADTATANAKKAGLAWSESSGLTWEQKYSKWVASFVKVDARNYGKTIRITTPWGKTLDGPVLECADVAIFLRATFAAWYHLPFYLTGWKNGATVYFGHMGVVDRNGNPVSGFPQFKAQYKDHEKTWRSGTAWPTDTNLRGKHVGTDDNAAGVKIGETALKEGDGAGAYLDELHLNKRAAHLQIILDGYFGSANLADGANLFHIKPEATAPGDALVERWQKEGIGHTLPVVAVNILPSGKMRVNTASGSMPRRQPVWEDEAQSGNYFKMEATGGEGEAYDGTAYAKLGGGIRRWRTPVVSGGRWNNNVSTANRANYIEDGNLTAIAARPARFKELLAEDTPEAARDAALATIETARRELGSRPASCSQRTKREEAFDALYTVMQTSFGKSKADVDKQYRKLEDHVFAELGYAGAKTCCWNSTTPQMAEIVLDYATKEKARNDAAGVCRQPTAFKASAGGKYDTWKAHAASLGRAADWKEWSEDEPCAQRGAAEDPLGSHTANMCR